MVTTPPGYAYEVYACRVSLHGDGFANELCEWRGQSNDMVLFRCNSSSHRRKRDIHYHTEIPFLRVISDGTQESEWCCCSKRTRSWDEWTVCS